jgi:histidyl-tRNA synthetase
MSSIAGPRGTNDVLPVDQPYWRFVRDTAERVAARFGYQPIEIPIFEEAALFERGTGESSDIVRKELYRLEPRTEDSKRYAVRPEPTAGIARAYIQHGMASLPQPVKLCFFGPVLRYDRPQAGRVRQHTQFDIEALGEAGPEVDAEVIEVLWRFYDELGLRDLTMLINTIGDQVCRPAYIEKLREYYRPLLRQVCDDDRERFEKNPLRLFDCKEQKCQPIKLGAPKLADYLCDACRDHFARLRGYLEALGIRYEVEPLLVRGLDYYTRTVFEAVPPAAGSQGTVGAGGRYDGLIELLGGRPTPGIGFGTGFERIILNLKRVGAEPPPLSRPEVFVAFLGEAARAEAVLLASELRRAGVPAQLSFGERSLKAQMRSANTAGAAYAAIIGDDEVRSSKVVVRDLRANEQQEIARGEVVGRFAGEADERE